MKVRSINYHNRKFETVKTSNKNDFTKPTEFHFKQINNILIADYFEGAITYGHLLGLVDEYGTLDLKFHQVSLSGEIQTGTCTCFPEILENGKILLHTSWGFSGLAHNTRTCVIQESNNTCSE